jgi:hypothetical protein
MLDEHGGLPYLAELIDDRERKYELQPMLEDLK